VQNSVKSPKVCDDEYIKDVMLKMIMSISFQYSSIIKIPTIIRMSKLFRHNFIKSCPVYHFTAECIVLLDTLYLHFFAFLLNVDGKISLSATVLDKPQWHSHVDHMLTTGM